MFSDNIVEIIFSRRCDFPFSMEKNIFCNLDREIRIETFLRTFKSQLIAFPKEIYEISFCSYTVLAIFET